MTATEIEEMRDKAGIRTGQQPVTSRRWNKVEAGGIRIHVRSVDHVGLAA
jgi:hypothetical protein